MAMQHDPAGRIVQQKNSRRIRILAGDKLIANTNDAIELREVGYPVRQYIPRKDIAMQYLQRSEKTTYCPFKGDASYYSIVLDDRTIENAAWSYEQPFPAMADIRERIAFDAGLVEENSEPE